MTPQLYPYHHAFDVDSIDFASSPMKCSFSQCFYLNPNATSMVSSVPVSLPPKPLLKYYFFCIHYTMNTFLYLPPMHPLCCCLHYHITTPVSIVSYLIPPLLKLKCFCLCFITPLTHHCCY